LEDDVKIDRQGSWVASLGFVFVLIGLWWLTLPGIPRGAVVFLLSGTVFIAGGVLRWRAERRRRAGEHSP
jgi:uncharacterized membrane protein HdeD (DUF308 family)